MIDKHTQSIIMTSKTFAKERDYWSQKLSGDFLPSQFPVEHRTQSTAEESLIIRSVKSLSSTASTKLSELGNHNGMAIYMMAVTAVQYVLRRYTGQTDITVGMPRLGVNDSNDNGYLYLRTEMASCTTFRELLMATRETVAEAIEHENFPVSVLFEEEMPMYTLVMLDSIHDRSIAGKGEADLCFLFSHTEGGLSVELIGKPALYSESSLERIAEHVIHYLEAVAANPATTLADADILSADEKDVLLNRFNDTAMEFPRELTIQQAFEQVVVQQPNAVAIEFDGESWTFAEVNHKANQLAHAIRAQYEIGANDLIGIKLDRSEQMIISMLAVLKAGAAYVPLDPAYPRERISYIAQDSGLKALITEDSFAGQFGHEIVIDRDAASISTQPTHNPELINQAGDLCYVIYTSGSTGKPKGVMVTHHNVINFLYSMDQKLSPESDDVMLSVTTISFDISVLEILWTLTRGIQVVLRPSGELTNFDRILHRKSKQVNMEFSIFFFSSYDNNDPAHKYKLMLDSAKYGDQHGFRAVWTPERHFHEFGGLFPNPSVTSAALAMVTEQMQIRSGSVVSPLHDAIRITEDWSVVDNLSGGRVGISFAAGWHPDDFVFGQSDFADRYHTMFTQIEEVRTLWQGGSVKRMNGLGKTIDVQTYPRPLQENVPIWVTTGGNKESFIRAGKIGANVLTHFLGQDFDTLEENIAAYRHALADAGYDPTQGKISLMLHTYMHDDLEHVKQVIKKPFTDYLRTSVDLLKRLADNANIDENTVNDESVMEQLLEVAFDKYWKLSLMGTPETCAAMTENLAKIGVDEIACLIDFGIDYQEVMNSLRRIGEWKQGYEAQDTSFTSSPVTMMQTTPSLLKLLASDDKSERFLASLRTLLVGGEAFPPGLAEEIRGKSSTKILNMYGPTETTVWSSVRELPREEKQIMLGGPIGNTQIYILNDLHELMPIGISGEICIGGEGVTRGYLNRPELTQERFIVNPFSDKPDEYLYKTGDMGRLNADGTIEFLGRKDYQVKVRGHRIELGEIEEAMLILPSIREAVVIDKQDQTGSTQLIAYYVSDREWKIGDLRDAIGENVPDYMIPAFFVRIPKLPLTPNGKIDRKALPTLTAGSDNSHYVAPRNSTEQLLVQVWQKVLGVSQVGITENFFHLGGDSIKAIQVSSLMQKYGKKIDIKDLFQNPTVERLSEHVKSLSFNADAQRLVEGELSLTPIQHWFWQHGLADPHHYNHSVMLWNKDGWDEAILRRLFGKLTEHHDALRLRFDRTDGLPRVYNHGLEGQHVIFDVLDLRGMDDYASRIGSEANRLQAGLDLQDGPLVRVGLFQTDEGDHLLLVIHHLVIDGISWRILFDDLSSGYEQAKSGIEISFQAKTDSFLNWSEQLHAYANSDEVFQEIDYWKQITGADVSPLPKDYNEPGNYVETMQRVSFELNPTETARLLKDVNAAYGTEINDILLSGLSLALYNWSGHSQRTFMIDVEGHGREHIPGSSLDISHTVGWFTSLFPTLLQVKQNDVGQHILAIKESLHQIPNKGFGYGLLRYLCTRETDLAQQLDVRSEIIFNYLGQFDQDVETDLFTPSPYSTGNNISPRNKRPYTFEINGKIHDQKLQIELDYNTNHYNELTVIRFLESYKMSLQEIIAHCIEKKATNAETQQYEPFPMTDVQLAYYFGRNDEFGLGGISPHNYSEGVMQLDLARFNESLNKVIKRHPMLRAVFIAGQQQILPEVPDYVIEVTDISGMSESAREAWILTQRKEISHRVYAPDTWPLFEVKAASLGDGQYHLFICYDLLVTDAISNHLINRNLMAYYQNPELVLPELEYTFRDYILEYERLKQSEIYQNAKMYWQNKLESFPSAPELPYRQKPTEIKEAHFTRQSRVFSRDEWDRFIKVAQDQNVTPSTLLCTVYAQVLGYWSNQPHMAINLPIINRYPFHEQVDEIVGEFTSLLLLEIDLQSADAFFDKARQIQGNLLEALENRHYDGVEFIRDIVRHRKLANTAVMPIVFTSLLFNELSQTTDNEEEFGEGVGINLTSQTYLDCQVLDKNGQLVIWWDYVEELFDENVIHTMFDQFTGIIEQIMQSITSESTV
ncbi:MupA/Atu3671 family FMN-dependent luciferase-like monooxygenase [Brevibacillus dissolubilis]|uniref:MupA/Atu3671 family FMN-dependent luciferase-like monooxygenase n=1 Tax=Brevibacillus dissolubilis TaxID=1844116 RepID=UPI001117201B|nr:MupA/Atu3671 family FMN-dependent luciferase-like monooxygenase [Brevibacillus dissolubilis]